jgi:uncharacterized phage protein (TIGR01671 family)
MIEIKFRAKDADTGKWQKGFYVYHETTMLCMATEKEIAETRQHLLVFDGCCDWNMPMPWYQCNIDPSTLGQYTNLHDSEGTEVYAQDILRDELNRYWIVYAAPGGFCICRTDEWVKTCGHPIMANGLSELQSCSWVSESCVVVGNIHDNPGFVAEGK